MRSGRCFVYFGIPTVRSHKRPTFLTGRKGVQMSNLIKIAETTGNAALVVLFLVLAIALV